VATTGIAVAAVQREGRMERKMQRRRAKRAAGGRLVPDVIVPGMVEAPV
jgi:hypothetical protein